MSKRTSLVLVTLTAAFMLLFGSATVIALRSLSLQNNPRSWTLTQREVSYSSEVGEIICDTTIRKTVEGVIAKVDRARFGRLIFFSTANCRGNVFVGLPITVTALGVEEAETAWKIVYRSFLGTLPEITGFKVQIQNVRLLFEFLRLGVQARCLYEGPIEELAAVARGVIGRLRNVVGARTIPKLIARLETGNCPGEVEWLAEAWQPANEVIVRLI